MSYFWTPFSAYYNQFENEISAGYSEDSDYTSDLNYPVGQHANSSASQFRTAAHQIHTPQRSLETSRENSYEREDAPNQQQYLSAPMTHQHHLSPGFHRQRHLGSSAHQVNITYIYLFHFVSSFFLFDSFLSLRSYILQIL